MLVGADSTAPPGRSHRYAVLDTYRFLAAAGVVAYHFEGHFQPFLHTETLRLERFQHFVDFFFVLSGFVIMCTYGQRLRSLPAYGDFLWRRFARLYPLHLAATLVSGLIGVVVLLAHIKLRVPEVVDLKLLPSNLLLIHAWGVNSYTGLNAPSWSISAEVFVYLLFPLLALLLRQVGAAVAILAAIGFAVIVEIVRAHYGMLPGPDATYDFGIFRALPGFFIGMAIYVLVDAVPPRPFSWLYAHAVALAIVALMLLQAPPYAIIVLFPPLVALLALAERGGKGTILAAPLFVLFGNASYAIYLLHSYVQVLAVGCVRALGVTSPLGLFAVALLFFALILAISVASYLWFETPTRRWLSRFHPFGTAARGRISGADLARPAAHRG